MRFVLMLSFQAAILARETSQWGSESEHFITAWNEDTISKAASLVPGFPMLEIDKPVKKIQSVQKIHQVSETVCAEPAA